MPGEVEPRPLPPPLSGKVIARLAVVVLLVTIAATVGLVLAVRGSGQAGVLLDAVRTGLSLGIGGGGAFALYLAWRRQRSTDLGLIQKDQEHRLQSDSADHTRLDATERRITELYAKAADQLGSDKPTVRLAGIYAFERLGQGTTGQRAAIGEVLCGYLRMGSAADEPQVRQAVLDVLIRHNDPADQAEQWPEITLRLRGADLTGMTLARACLAGADLTSATLTAADLTGADLTRARLRGVTLAGADLTKATLTRANLARATLAKANLTKASLAGANLADADLTGADLTMADLSNAQLARAVLRGTNVAWANLRQAVLDRATLTGARLGWAVLIGASLVRADLTGAGLGWANLASADLSGATMVGADLTKATLTRADLTGADLTDAVLIKTDLAGASLRKVIAPQVGLSSPGGAVR